MSQEPWYQSKEITEQEVHIDLFELLKFKLDDHVKLNKTILSVIKKNKNEHEFGSWRGYSTFLRTEFKNNVIEQYSYKK